MRMLGSNAVMRADLHRNDGGNKNKLEGEGERIKRACCQLVAANQRERERERERGREERERERAVVCVHMKKAVRADNALSSRPPSSCYCVPQQSSKVPCTVLFLFFLLLLLFLLFLPLLLLLLVLSSLEKKSSGASEVAILSCTACICLMTDHCCGMLQGLCGVCALACDPVADRGKRATNEQIMTTRPHPRTAVHLFSQEHGHHHHLPLFLVCSSFFFHYYYFLCCCCYDSLVRSKRCEHLAAARAPRARLAVRAGGRRRRTPPCPLHPRAPCTRPPPPLGRREPTAFLLSSSSLHSSSLHFFVF